jgi:hypothetical protein
MMHLVGPHLTTTGKKKGKAKFRNSEQAQRTRALKDEWQELLDRHGVEAEDRKRKRAMAAPAYVPPKPSYRGADQPRQPSVTSNVGGVCARPETKVYTGDKMLGIATMHKSNSVPVFRAEDAVEIARMRRG